MDLYGSICLTDIDKSLITTGKNGKQYLNIELRERREPSQYGHTHYIKQVAKAEQRKEGVNYFIGDMKPSQYQQQQAPNPQQQNIAPQLQGYAPQQQVLKDDLPF
jgi:hypothetical protein